MRPRRTRRAGGSIRTAWHQVAPLLPSSGDVDELVSAIARRRGRPIKILACELPADAPSGVWIPTENVDYVIHLRGVPAAHRAVVLCHELSHMLLEHQPRQAAINVADIAPSIRPEVAQRFLARHAYEDDVETQAESFATRLATELSRRAAAQRTAEMMTKDSVSERLR